jgi:hypothetical protein
MNCSKPQHDIVLSLYDELSEKDQGELRRHLGQCVSCQEFAESERQLHSSLASVSPKWNMPADLLVECRRNLSEELDRLEARRVWWQFPARVFRVRWLEAAALVSIGLALGVYVSAGRSTPNDRTGQFGGMPVPPESVVANLRIIEADPVSGEISLTGDMVSPMRLQGRLDDLEILQAVISALGAPTNPGERLRIVKFLAPNARDAVVQDALIGALLHDDNPGVRLYALGGLKPFAADEGVRMALLYALENDEIPGIRVAAIDALAPLTQDEATAEVVQEATRADPNTYIRNRALQFVAGR